MASTFTAILAHASTHLEVTIVPLGTNDHDRSNDDQHEHNHGHCELHFGWGDWIVMVGLMQLNKMIYLLKVALMKT